MRRTLGPHCPNQLEPSLQFLAELPRTRVDGASELADKTEFAEERNPFSAASVKQRYESQVNRSSAAGLAAEPSMNTAKPAIEEHFKTGQRGTGTSLYPFGYI